MHDISNLLFTAQPPQTPTPPPPQPNTPSWPPNHPNITFIVNKFIDYEAENYALFNYINALRDESESLNKKRKKLEEEV